MKKTLLAILCLAFASTTWSQSLSEFQFNYDIGLGISTDEVKELAEPSRNIVQSLSVQVPVMEMQNTSALLGLQFTHANLKHADKFSPADFAGVTQDLVTNTALLAPTLKFSTALGEFHPYVEAGAGLMTQRSNIVTSAETEASNLFDCNTTEVTTDKINDMQTQLGFQTAVGLQYGVDCYRFNLSLNYMQGTQDFLMPVPNEVTSTENGIADARSAHGSDMRSDYSWKSVKPSIVNIKLGMTIILDFDQF